MKTSETVGNLAEALAKAQGEIKPAPKDAENPFFKSKYADFSSIVSVCKAPLAKNGLSFSQGTKINENGTVTLETRLMHQSGEWIECEYPVTPVKPDPQSMGSALSYAKRYSLGSMLGIVSEEDDDGNVATGKPISGIQSPRPVTTPVQRMQQPIPNKAPIKPPGVPPGFGPKNEPKL